MAARHAVMLPYRDTNNREVKYVPVPATIQSQPSTYDSDSEPLINSAPAPELDDDALLRFTATGRPIPGFKASGLQNLGGDMFTLPQLLPKRYTDDSIIPAIVVGVIPSPKADSGNEKKKKRTRRSSFITRLKTGMAEEKRTDGKLMKVVYMPRGDYLKWFARGSKGEYIGSEPKREWTEDELDETFKQYQPVVEKRKMYTGII